MHCQPSSCHIVSCCIQHCTLHIMLVDKRLQTLVMKVLLFERHEHAQLLLHESLATCIMGHWMYHSNPSKVSWNTSRQCCPNAAQWCSLLSSIKLLLFFKFCSCATKMCIAKKNLYREGLQITGSMTANNLLNG